MEKEVFDYSKYTDSVHRMGRIGLSIGALMLLSAPFLFGLSMSHHASLNI